MWCMFQQWWEAPTSLLFDPLFPCSYPVSLCFNLQSYKQQYLTLQAVSFPSPQSGVTCILHGLYHFLNKESVYPAVACLLKFGSRRHWKRHNHKQEKVWTSVTFVLEPLERGFSDVLLAKISLSVLFRKWIFPSDSVMLRILWLML